jgi:hypothetical protein
MTWGQIYFLKIDLSPSESSRQSSLFVRSSGRR